MIKTGLDGVRTLAIGDGANDVAMIQEAHIGNSFVYHNNRHNVSQ
jgi:P-type E1-E2 ATPase